MRQVFGDLLAAFWLPVLAGSVMAAGTWLVWFYSGAPVAGDVAMCRAGPLAQVGRLTRNSRLARWLRTGRRPDFGDDGDDTITEADSALAWNGGASWVPFNYRGSFQGSGYKISNMMINSNGRHRVGLFAQLGTAAESRRPEIGGCGHHGHLLQ